MSTINLTSPESALAYLRSLPANEPLSLPAVHDSNIAGDAVRAASECDNANNWAIAHGRRWEWTAGELAAVLESDRNALIDA